MGFILDVPQGYAIERLDATAHSRDTFSCGVASIDEYLKTKASQSQGRNCSATHVLIEAIPGYEGKRSIVGYVTLVTYTLLTIETPYALKKKTNQSTIPAILLARMGVDNQHKEKRLGEFLLKFALKTGCDLNELSGCSVVLVDAKDENIKKFYLKYGFAELPSRPLRLYLTVDTVKILFKMS